MTRAFTDYEKALKGWLQAAVDAVAAGYEVFPEQDRRPGSSDSYVIYRAVQRQILGQPVRATTTTPWEGGPGYTGGQARTYRIQADINVYGPHAVLLMEAIEKARWKPDDIPKDKRLRIETLSNWQDLTALEGPGYRTRHMAEVAFQWVSIRNYEVTRTIERGTPLPSLLS